MSEACAELAPVSFDVLHSVVRRRSGAFGGLPPARICFCSTFLSASPSYSSVKASPSQPSSTQAGGPTKHPSRPSFTQTGGPTKHQAQPQQQRQFFCEIGSHRHPYKANKCIGVSKNLPTACTSRMNPTQCFFPQYLLPYIKTPLFILNTAYDTWQVQSSLAPAVADPNGLWRDCKLNPANCTSSQLAILQNFRNEMLKVLKDFVGSPVEGLFINSCFAHCQSERQDTWFAPGSPRIKKGWMTVVRTQVLKLTESFSCLMSHQCSKTVAQAVGDWYFERSVSKEIDCPYPCDQTCHNLIFRPK